MDFKNQHYTRFTPILYDQKEDNRKLMEFIEKTLEADKDGKLQSTSTKQKMCIGLEIP